MTLSNNLGCSDYAIECLTALEWHIPLNDWWSMPRGLRAQHIATLLVRRQLDSYGSDNVQ